MSLVLPRLRSGPASRRYHRRVVDRVSTERGTAVLASESWRTAPVLVSALATVLVLLTATGCTAPLRRETTADRTTPPKVGACYRLTPRQTERPSSDRAPVPCSSPHTAQTFAVGTLPASTGEGYSAA